MHRFIPRSVLAFAITLPLAAQEHDLKLTATKGSSIWLVQTTTQGQEIDMGGQMMESKNVMTVAAHIMIQDVGDDGVVTVEAKLGRVRGTFGVPMMGDFEFDSLDKAKAGDAGSGAADDFGGMGMPDFDAIGGAAASLAGSKFTAKIDSYGRIKSVDGLEEALAEMNKRAGEMGSQVLAGSFSQKGFENLVESAFGKRPEKPTAIGGTWESDAVSDDGPGTATKITLTLAKCSDKAFEVTGQGTVEKPAAKPAEGGADESEEAAMMREMQQNMKIENGKVVGRAVVSREDGFVVEASTEISMDVTMPGPFGDMSMKMKSVVTTKRTTEAAAMQRGAKAADKATDKAADK